MWKLERRPPAVMLRTLGDHAAARKEWERAEELDPLSSLVFLNAAGNAWNCGDYETAIRDAPAASRSILITASTMWFWPRAEATLGKFRDAEQALERAAVVLKSSPLVEEERALLLAISGRRSDALQLLKRMEAEGRGTGGGMMRAWAAAGDTDRALWWLDRWIQKAPQYARIGLDLPSHPAFEAFRRHPHHLEVRRNLDLPPPFTGTTNTSPAAR